MAGEPLDLEELQRRLGYRFRRRELVRLALTHRSAGNQRGAEQNERLEFLGDAVLGVVAAHWLYRSQPEATEGELARQKSYLVSAAALAGWGEVLEIGDLLVLGAGEESSGGRHKRSLIADAVEALLGAAFLDGGLEVVARIVEPFLEETLAMDPQLALQDVKTRLQEYLQGEGKDLPVYRLVAEIGPPHERVFHVECWIAGRRAGCGRGHSKKAAERTAAAEALAVVAPRPAENEP